MYLLDSNIYIRGFRESAFGLEVEDFQRRHLARVLVSAVVVSEVLVGAQGADGMRRVQRTLVEPFRQRKRFLIPSWQAWECAVAVDRGIRARGSHAGKLASRSFFHDMLIAATARETGATIVTFNTADFQLIAEYVDIDFVEPWPTGKAA